MQTTNVSFKPSVTLYEDLKFISQYKNISVNKMLIEMTENFVKNQKQEIEEMLLFKAQSEEAERDMDAGNFLKYNDFFADVR